MEIKNRNEAQAFITKDTSEIREILSPRNSSIRNQSLAEARLVPGKKTEEHYHKQSEEIYYVLQGQGKMWIENESNNIQTGDGIVILPGKKHQVENTGPEDLVFLCCCAPTYTHEDTVLT
jgi:mannose-6-phosphate isomerase-like protein (cupin superfamily)